MITFSHSIGEKMKHRYQSFTRFGRQFQSLKRHDYAVWTSVSFPLCQRSCLIWRIMAKNDEYNDEYLCRDFFVGFNCWSKLSFQIPEFRVHCCQPKQINLSTNTLMGVPCQFGNFRFTLE